MASHEENTNENPSLPVDMISEIFSRLPADCLRDLKHDFEYNNFKSWKSLLSSPEFAKTHLSRSTNDPRLTHHRLLLIGWPFVEQANIPYMKLSSCSVTALLNDNDETDSEANDNDETDPEANDNDETDPETDDNDETDPETDDNDETDPEANDNDETDPETNDNDETDPETDDDDDETDPKTVEECHPGDDNIHVIGYCNGLFCVSSRDVRRDSEEIFLWNPFTRRSTRLPKEPKHKHGGTLHGFCYDEPNDDYKVFSIFCHWYRTYENNVSVYSSKSGGWRSIIGDYCFGEIYSRRGSFANGAMHWLAERENMQINNSNSCFIISIDIKTETSREVSLPPEVQGERRTTLGTFGENLSVLYQYEACADFWVMKECGVEESWTKLFTILFTTGLPCHSWIKPLCTSIGGDIMLLSGSAIVLYNPKSNTFKKLLDMSDIVSDLTSCHVYTYVENLVSPPNY